MEEIEFLRLLKSCRDKGLIGVGINTHYGTAEIFFNERALRLLGEVSCTDHHKGLAEGRMIVDSVEAGSYIRTALVMTRPSETFELRDVNGGKLCDIVVNERPEEFKIEVWNDNITSVSDHSIVSRVEVIIRKGADNNE